jgi:Gluconate 2-dehydrogenase subunit 3
VGWLTAAERATLDAALDRLIPAGDGAGAGADADAGPGAVGAGVGDYVDGLLDAFAVDPPRIFAGGPGSGRRGAVDGPGFAKFTPLTRIEEIAWRQRIGEWQAAYRSGLAALGADFPTLPGADRDGRLEATPEFTALLYEHACEGMYAAPEYGGNRDLAGWRLANWPGDVAPLGWTPAQVSDPVANR